MKVRCAVVGVLLLGLSAGCAPTPDYRLTVLDVPSDAGLLLLAWKSDTDTVSKTSLALPVGDLTSEQRRRYTIGLDLGDIPDSSGIVSVATVNRNGCITSVVSADDAPRSSSTRVTQLELELDPRLNSNVFVRNVVPSPPVMCPPNPPFPPFPDPVSCPKVPGLSGMPTVPTLVPTRPVVINVLRELIGPARVFDGGRLRFFGWGFDRAKLAFGPSCYSSNCFLNLQMKYPQYTTQLVVPMSYSYPTLGLASYSELDIGVAQIKNAFKVDPTTGFQDAVALCIAISAGSFLITNSDGNTASYAEVLPKL